MTTKTTLITTASAFMLLCALALPAAAQQKPTSREYPYVYKSARAMGMGGAYTAVGGRVDALFYNPAGLINIPKDKGWEVNLVNVSAEVGTNAIDFVDDMGDAFDTLDLNGDGSTSDDELKAVNDVLARYRGKNMHVRIADFTSIGKAGNTFAFGIGAVGSGRIDAMPHQGFGSEGLLEVNSDLTYGAVGGVSFALKDGVFLGLGLKQLHRESIIHNFTAREMVEKQDTLDDYITEDLKKEGDATGFDAGLIWKFAPSSWWRPSIGVSAMNIGDLDFKEAGVIPMTVNAGFAVNPNISAFRSLTFAVDYIDVLEKYTEDKDGAKRLRYGAELQLFDIWPIELALRAGMYEGYPTYGADLRLLTLLVSYAHYTEEVGAYAGQEKDTRHLVTVNIGW